MFIVTTALARSTPGVALSRSHSVHYFEREMKVPIMILRQTYKRDVFHTYLETTGILTQQAQLDTIRELP